MKDCKQKLEKIRQELLRLKALWLLECISSSKGKIFGMKQNRMIYVLI
jgi:hypothetical protein